MLTRCTKKTVGKSYSCRFSSTTCDKLIIVLWAIIEKKSIETNILGSKRFFDCQTKCWASSRKNFNCFCAVFWFRYKKKNHSHMFFWEITASDDFVHLSFAVNKNVSDIKKAVKLETTRRSFSFARILSRLTIRS